MASFLARNLSCDNEIWKVEGIPTLRKKIFDLVCSLYEEQETEPQESKVVDSPPSSPLPVPSSLPLPSPMSKSPSTSDHTSDDDGDAVSSQEKEDSPGEQLVKEANVDTDNTEPEEPAAELKLEPTVIRMTEVPGPEGPSDPWRAVRSS